MMSPTKRVDHIDTLQLLINTIALGKLEKDTGSVQSKMVKSLVIARLQTFKQKKADLKSMASIGRTYWSRPSETTWNCVLISLYSFIIVIVALNNGKPLYRNKCIASLNCCASVAKIFPLRFFTSKSRCGLIARWNL
jgi:hypothetical protein